MTGAATVAGWRNLASKHQRPSAGTCCGYVDKAVSLAGTTLTIGTALVYLGSTQVDYAQVC